MCFSNMCFGYTTRLNVYQLVWGLDGTERVIIRSFTKVLHCPLRKKIVGSRQKGWTRPLLGISISSLEWTLDRDPVWCDVGSERT